MGFSLDEFKNGASNAGGRLGDTVNGALGAARRGLCKAYKDHPGWLTGSNLDPLGLDSSFRRQLLNGLCDDYLDEFPPEPERPFEGGQCCDVSYTINYSYSAKNKFDSSTRGPFTGSRPLRAGKLVSVSASGDGGVLTVTTVDCSGVSSVDTYGQLVFPYETAEGFAITSVTAPPGVDPLQCGSPPPIYDGGPNPPGDQYNSDEPFTVGGDGPTNPPVTIAPNIEIRPNINLPDINVPVDICVSAFGCFTIGIDGFNPSGGSGGISEDDLERLLDAADTTDDIKGDADDLRRKGDVDVDDKGNQQGNQEEETGELYGIFIEVTGYPSGYGRRFGQPQIFNFGRAHFTRAGFYTEEIPITTVRQWCPAQPDSDGYALALNPGVTATVKVVKPVPRT